MIELLNDHFSEILIGLFTVIGAFIGVLIPTLYNIYKDRKERRDKYFFALIDKRFEIYNEAYYWCEQLKYLIFEPDTKIYEETRKARSWYASNNLYIEPIIRRDFFNFIKKVEMYKGQLELYKQTGREKGWDSEEVERKENELHVSFEDIMRGIQTRIQNKIDTYYNFIEDK